MWGYHFYLPASCGLKTLALVPMAIQIDLAFNNTEVPEGLCVNEITTNILGELGT